MTNQIIKNSNSYRLRCWRIGFGLIVLL